MIKQVQEMFAVIIAFLFIFPETCSSSKILLNEFTNIKAHTPEKMLPKLKKIPPFPKHRALTGSFKREYSEHGNSKYEIISPKTPKVTENIPKYLLGIILTSFSK
jgi:hypothetical protein